MKDRWSAFNRIVPSASQETHYTTQLNDVFKTSTKNNNNNNNNTGNNNYNSYNYNNGNHYQFIIIQHHQKDLDIN